MTKHGLALGFCELVCIARMIICDQQRQYYKISPSGRVLACNLSYV
jgi:hypothetical protein